jgi:hypothetical protein
LKGRALEEPLSENETSEIVYLEFDVDTLRITVLFDGYKLDVAFDSPAGFKVLDEGDLLEFWPECSLPNGWLFEIESQGWLDQETRRDGFVSAHNPEIKEYFVVGVNYCVNVLAWEDPSVVESIR